MTNPEWEELQKKCNGLGITIAEHLRNLIKGQAVEKEQLSQAVEGPNELAEVNKASGSIHELNSIFERLELEGRTPEFGPIVLLVEVAGMASAIICVRHLTQKGDYQ